MDHSVHVHVASCPGGVPLLLGAEIRVTVSMCWGL